MNNINKTLYIPLYGKSFVSRKGIILSDKKAEEIWAKEGFKLKGKSRSKWLAYYMGIRSAVFDSWVKEKMAESGDGVIIHIGCGMDSRAERIGTSNHLWFDFDFPEVITERQRYFSENDCYKMISGDAREPKWLSKIQGSKNAIIIMEGVSMYLRPEELNNLLIEIGNRFDNVDLLMDCYSVFAAKASKYKNPINDVGVTQVYGIDDPTLLVRGTPLHFRGEKEMTPGSYIEELSGKEKTIFKKLYAGKMAKKMYKLYEFEGRKISLEK